MLPDIWNVGILEGWERNLDHPGKAFFLKPIIPSFRSKVERPRVQRVKAHHSIFAVFHIKDVTLSQSSSCFL